MIKIKITALLTAFVLVCFSNFYPSLASSLEAQKTPVTNAEISVLKIYSSEQIKLLLSGDDISLNKFAASSGVEVDKIKKLLSSFSDKELQTLSSTSASEIDGIIAGAMDGEDVWVTALAAIGLLVLIAALAR